MSAARFVAVAAAIAAVVGLAGLGISRLIGVGVDWWIGLGSALLVGIFAALWWFAPRDIDPEGEGFAVVATEEAEPVAELVQEEEREKKD